MRKGVAAGRLRPGGTPVPRGAVRTRSVLRTRGALPPRSALRAAGALVAGLALGGCAATDDPAAPPTGNHAVELELSGFPVFAQSEAHFELWIRFGNPAAEVSAGRFKIGDARQIVGLDYQERSFSIDPSDGSADADGDGLVDWDRAEAAFVTLEAPDDVDSSPSGATLIGGPVVARTAFMTTSSAEGLDLDLTSAGGSFALETPTTTAATDSTTSPLHPDWDLAGGVWFATPGGAAGTLDLPPLPVGGGWRYTGWLSLGFAESFSLGSFTDPGAPDSDGPGPLGSGDAGSGYSFPGSDFPTDTHGVDFSGGSVFVTLEPAGNPDGPGPFFLTVLRSDPIPASPPPGLSRPLFGVVSLFPSGTVRIPDAPAG